MTKFCVYIFFIILLSLLLYSTEHHRTLLVNILNRKTLTSFNDALLITAGECCCIHFSASRESSATNSSDGHIQTANNSDGHYNSPYNLQFIDFSQRWWILEASLILERIEKCVSAFRNRGDKNALIPMSYRIYIKIKSMPLKLILVKIYSSMRFPNFVCKPSNSDRT